MLLVWPRAMDQKRWVGMDRYDVIIIGGGLNGLVSAAYLAKAGRSVVVLAQAGEGMSDYSDGWAGADGFVFPTLTSHISSLPKSVSIDLGLGELGIRRRAPRNTAIVSSQSGCMIRDAEPDAMDRRLRSVDPREADAYRNFCLLISRQRRYVDQLAALDGGKLPKKNTLLPFFAEVGQDDLIEATQTLTSSAADLLDRYFTLEPLKLLLLASSLQGQLGAMGLGPLSPTSAFGLLGDPLSLVQSSCHSINGEVHGGTPRLLKALRGLLDELGVTFVTDADVAEIAQEKGEIKGVALAGGQFIECEILISDIDPKRFAFTMLDWKELPEKAVDELAGFKNRAQVAQLNLVLDAVPNFTDLPDGFAATEGVVFLLDDLMSAEKAFDAWKSSILPKSPPMSFEVVGKRGDKVYAVVTLHYIPGQLLDGGWSEGTKIKVISEAINRLLRVSPDFDKHLIDAKLVTPPDFETHLGIVGGNHACGNTSLDQILFNRPNPQLAENSSLAKGLFFSGLTHRASLFYDGIAGAVVAKEILAGPKWGRVS
jgi:phytoene dehydrogenase-like protein